MKKLLAIIVLAAAVFFLIWRSISTNKPEEHKTTTGKIDTAVWVAPDISQLPDGAEKDLVLYGRELIENTAKYLGPRGKVAAISNGLNCQNCHLDAGTRLNSNCLAAVANSYPKFRNRSGKIETVEFRINECMERSLNGHVLDSNSREMKAMKGYMLWLGKNYHPQKDVYIAGTGVLDYLPRAADPEKGKLVFQSRCVSCHGFDGLGLFMEDSLSYKYPPLWGTNSYNVSAGMYTLSKLAGFIKYNMPYSAVPLRPQLSDEEAWDVAAFINSQQRSQKQFSQDWPDISRKPVDYPFGPYTDSFSALQHKYGPYQDIVKAKQKQQKIQ